MKSVYNFIIERRFTVLAVFALLIYSNRQEFKSPTNKHSFTVNGYTPTRWIIKY